MPASYADDSAVSLCELWEREGNEVLKPLTHDPGRGEAILLAARRLGDAGRSQATLFVRARKHAVCLPSAQHRQPRLTLAERYEMMVG
jgi:hypothetical protein